MIKAIFFDIDGTILSHKTKKVPQSTEIAFQKLKENNILIFIATGRHISEIADLPIHHLPIDGYITLNGQYCYNDKEVIYSLPIDNKDVTSLLNYIKENPFPCMFVEKDKMYINYINEAVHIVQNAISTPLPDIGDINNGYNKPIYQIIPYDINEKKEKNIMLLLPHCKKTRWHPLAIDIIPKTGGKQNGIKNVLEYYHISKEETMAFGDGENDIDMFHFVEKSIALGNASDYVKSQANDVTDDIDEDGVYNALIKYQMI